MPAVIGDGRRTLERLILGDPRAVCMTPLYLLRNQARRDYIIPAGERVELVEIGTHCRGAIFGDGSAVVTPALEAMIDSISRGYEGFFFGRYDIRATSVEALKQARDFRIIELNGVTSEATHIYDPAISLVPAYRILIEQWRLAFEIGAANRARGLRAPSLGDMWRAFRAFEPAGENE